MTRGNPMTDQVQTRMTAAEFLALPETNLPTELINGELIAMPAPALLHQRALLRLIALLQSLITGGELFFAPVDVYLDDLNIVQSDALWITPNNTTCVSVEGKYLRGAPDLIVEVLSPGTARRDRRDKFRLYQKYGVRECWMLEPHEQFIEVWQLVNGKIILLDVFGPDEVVTSPLLGSVRVQAIFSE